jgi:phage gpG-like protein
VKPSEFFRKVLNDLPLLERHIANQVVAVEAERIHAENFRQEQFTDTVPKKWPDRKKGDKNPVRRALLVQSGTLRRHALKGRVRDDSVEFVFPLEYERVHNEGLRAGRGKGFQMPQRQFVGESAVLKERILRKAGKLITNHLKSL